MARALTAAQNAGTPLSDRTLHLIDVENLVGACHLSTLQVRTAESAYRQTIQVAEGDHLIVSSSHHNAKPTWFGWGGSPRRLVRSGPDGADLALLAVIDAEGVSARFGRVVIGSGDGIFTEAAARLQAAGVEVSVVSRKRGLSRRLCLAVRDTRTLPEFEATVRAAA